MGRLQGVRQTPAQASQQVPWMPRCALPFFGGLHLLAFFLITQRPTPFAFVRQQVTRVGCPQVDFFAQRFIARLNRRGIVPAFAAALIRPRAHWT
jgi:hypothetical protein